MNACAILYIACTEGQGEQSGDTCVHNLYNLMTEVIVSFEGHCVCVCASSHTLIAFPVQ